MTTLWLELSFPRRRESVTFKNDIYFDNGLADSNLYLRKPKMSILMQYTTRDCVFGILNGRINFAESLINMKEN